MSVARLETRPLGEAALKALLKELPGYARREGRELTAADVAIVVAHLRQPLGVGIAMRNFSTSELGSWTREHESELSMQIDEACEGGDVDEFIDLWREAFGVCLMARLGVR